MLQFLTFNGSFVTTFYSLMTTYMQSVFVNKVKYDGFPLCVVDYGLGIDEGGVGSSDGEFARFEVGHNQFIINKNINENDDEILQAEVKVQ